MGFDMVHRFSVLVAVAALLLLAALPSRAAPFSDEKIKALGEAVLFGSPAAKDDALQKLVARGSLDVVATLILAVRYRRDDAAILSALNTLTGAGLGGWHDAMLWQEAHAEVKPHTSFRALKIEIFSRIDPNFTRFLVGVRSWPEFMKIRLEEVTWGGVVVDGIPSLDNPKLIAAGEADYLLDGDLVFGVDINGDVRAYPLRIMGWHEMFNEVIGGVPVALAYCTLCGAGILFETLVEGREEPFVFGSSGFLYRSNKLMFDRETDSLWNQFTGRPVAGPLWDSDIELKMRPVAITSWAKWKAKHPNTRVLSLETGHRRDYGSGVVYRDYFTSPDLMFPTLVRDESQVRRKDLVFGIRDVGAAKAWPLTAFDGGAVINDTVGDRNVVVLGDAATRTVRAYDRQDMRFDATDDDTRLAGPGGLWRVEENLLVGPDGQKLPRIAGHISYWFAWDGYLGVESALYSGRNTQK